jgi:hypothetical protein
MSNTVDQVLAAYEHAAKNDSTLRLRDVLVATPAPSEDEEREEKERDLKRYYADGDYIRASRMARELLRRRGPRNDFESALNRGSYFMALVEFEHLFCGKPRPAPLPLLKFGGGGDDEEANKKPFAWLDPERSKELEKLWREESEIKK